MAVGAQAQEQRRRDLGSQHQVQGLLIRSSISLELVHYGPGMPQHATSHVAASLSRARVVGTPEVFTLYTAVLTDH